MEKPAPVLPHPTLQSSSAAGPLDSAWFPADDEERASDLGKRTVVVFFLVDPSERVLSTAAVPPQQRDWISQELTAPVDGSHAHQVAAGPFDALGDEIGRTILANVPGLLSRADAEALRLELMSERKYFVDSQTKEVFEREIALCEH
jgi:Protein of unknown function (DUF4246)